MTLAAKDAFNNQQKTVTLSMNGAGTINEFCDNLTNIKNDKININKTSSSNVTKGVSKAEIKYAHNMVENPGPLTEMRGNPASNFLSGKYNVKVLDEDIILYRSGKKED